MKKLILFLCVCFGLSLNAQNNAVGFGFNYTRALQDFQENLDKDPKGFTINYAKGLCQSPFKLNLGFGISMYAAGEYEYEMYVDQYGSTDLVTVSEEDCFYSYNASLRYMVKQDTRLRPYLEGRLGGVSFFSSRMGNGSDNFEDNTTFHGTALQTGLGGGMLFDLTKDGFLFLDFGVHALRGAHTFYRSIDLEDQIQTRQGLNYGRKESHTNNVNFNLSLFIMMD